MTAVKKYLLPILAVCFIAAAVQLEHKNDRVLAFVQKYKPLVEVQRQGQLQVIEERGRELYSGDTVETDQNGFALVQFMDNSMAKVKPDSRLIVEGEVVDRQNSHTRIGLELGEIFLNVSEQGEDNFEVATNTSVASVKGTDFGASFDDYYWVEEGEVEVRVNRTGESATLTDRRYGRVNEDGTIETGELTDDELEEKSREYERMNSNAEPKIYELRFIDENGEVRVIEVKVFENDG